MPSNSRRPDSLEQDIGDRDAEMQSHLDLLFAEGHGLGIELESSHPPPRNRISVQTVPSGIPIVHEAPEHRAPSSADPFISPQSSNSFSGSTQYNGSPENADSSPRLFSKYSLASLRPTIQPSTRTDSDTSLLKKRGTDSTLAQDEESDPSQNTSSPNGMKRGRANWLTATTIGLAVYSTVFSGIFVCVATYGPRYGRHVHTNGVLTAASAAFMTSVFAKTIEMTFVTVVIALLGQVLSRRAVAQDTKSGITLAELNMRSWVVQPGTMISRWESVRYAGVTTLGIISVVAAVFAMLYTSAATALVQPQLKFGDWKNRSMQGVVRTSFANPAYITNNCNSPISMDEDREFRDETCASLEHAAMGYHNYYAYLGAWHDYVQRGGPSTNLNDRPKGMAFFNDNTTVIAPWVNVVDTAQVYQETGYIINKVSLAMPHTGVVAAAKDPANGIMQPEELDGLGVYDIRAIAPSPVAHVLCATLKSSDLTPFVYSLWKNASLPIDPYNWPKNLTYTDSHFPFPYLGGTPLDGIFGWGEAYGANKVPPVFPVLPSAYNTLLNDTTGVPWGRDSIYILGHAAPPTPPPAPDSNPDYFLCQLKASQTSHCTTQYNASSSGATLSAVCTSPTPSLNPSDPSSEPSLALDWPNIATPWANTLSLASGLYASNASNARLLSQLALRTPSLHPSKPSTAEALAVLAACTLLESSVDAPFVTYFNYTAPFVDPEAPGSILREEGVLQYFPAEVRAQEYASGGSSSYQKTFHIVLVGAFLINLFCLAYFVAHKEWFEDVSDPPNLFALAVNSPQSKGMGSGPRGRDFGIAWKVGGKGGWGFVQSRGTDRERGGWEGGKRWGGFGGGWRKR